MFDQDVDPAAAERRHVADHAGKNRRPQFVLLSLCGVSEVPGDRPFEMVLALVG